MRLNQAHSNSVICVPIFTQALLVGKTTSNAQFSDISANFTRIVNNPLGDYVNPNIFNTIASISSGIHLNWLLPKGLRTGHQNKEGEDPQYYVVPNRWIITRLWKSRNDDGTLVQSPVQVKQWVIESNALLTSLNKSNYNDMSLSFPYETDLSKPYRYIGRSYPLGTNVNNNIEYLSNLTALGYGDPLYPVMYPMHRNVFGFYDDLTDANNVDLKNVDIEYSVRGYYEDNYLLIVNEEQCNKDFEWIAPTNVTYPATIVLEGMLKSIQWIDKNTIYDANTKKMPELEIAIGNSSNEAYAALTETHTPNSEHLINIFMQNQLQDWVKTNGVFEVEYEKHALRFEMIIEQKKYQLKPLQQLSELQKLNSEQEELFRQLDSIFKNLQYLFLELETARKSLYVSWNKYMLLAILKDPMHAIEREELELKYKEEVQNYLQKIVVIEEKYEKQKSSWDEIEAKLKLELEDQYEVIKEVDDYFFEPNEPVILLKGITKGKQFELLQKHSQSTNEYSMTRNYADVLTTIVCEIQLNNDSLPIPINLNEVLSNIDLNSNYVNLLLESLLFSNLTQYDMIQVIKQYLHIDHFTPEQYIDISKQVSQFQAILQERCVKGETNYPPLDTFTTYEYPWNPMLLASEVEVFIDPLLYPKVNGDLEKPSLKNWELNGSDYNYIGPDYSRVNNGVVVSKLITTPYITEKVKSMVTNQLGEDALINLGDLNDQNIISQCLNNFNEVFAMQQLDIRYPPFVIKEGDANLAKKVAGQLVDFSYFKPIFDGFFSPIRAGFMNINKVRLIDSFGQFLDVDTRKISIAQDMYSKTFSKDNLIMLPPRFIQPTKLSINWINATSNNFCDFNIEDTPICGWIIPNFLDQSLLIYDKNGEMLGSLIVTGFDNDKIQWRDRPGTTHYYGSNIPDEGDPLPENMDKEMKGFLLAIINRYKTRREDVLTPLLTLMDRVNETNHPFETIESSGLSLFIGQPLVLTRLNIQLEQAGPPIEYTTIEMPGGSVDSPKINPVSQFEMPVWVGEQSHLNDGTVGFFIENGEDTYSTFHTAVDLEKALPDYFDSQYDIKLDNKPQGRTISMISNPLSTTHFISGMLPVYTEKLPLNLVQEQLAKLYLTFFTGPLLIGIEGFVTPIPNIENRVWSYLHIDETDKWVETKNIMPANGNAFLAKSPISIIEGWLKINLSEDKVNG